jgi:hypothetical protein
MSGVSIDHLVSVAVLIAAVILFVGLFNNTLSTAVEYQRNTSTAKKCSDLIDTILLTPGISINGPPTAFGLQDPMSSQYQLSPFSLMRLNSSSGTPVNYQKTGQTYSNLTTASNSLLLYPYSDMVNYSTALTLLGINGTYGFQLTLTPTITVSITEVSTNPLTLSLNVYGTGFPLANAPVSYCLVSAQLNGAIPDFPIVTNQVGTTMTNGTGLASVPFPGFVLSPSTTYAFIAYAHLNGVSGMGYYVHTLSGSKSVVPFLDALSAQRVLLAHGDDIPLNYSSSNVLFYNTTFVLTNQNYALQETILGSPNRLGNVTSGTGYSYVPVGMSSYTPGVLIIAYNNSTGNGGIVMLPWGFGSLGSTLTFGGTPISQKWVSTDIRQVGINGVSYQAKLSLWSTQGYQVIS